MSYIIYLMNGSTKEVLYNTTKCKDAQGFIKDYIVNHPDSIGKIFTAIYN